MKTIWKYTVIAIGQEFAFDMPVGAQLLSAQAQDGRIQLWAVVHKDQPLEKRWFIVLGTGWDIPFTGKTFTFISTTQIEGLVWHLFELS